MLNRSSDSFTKIVDFIVYGCEIEGERIKGISLSLAPVEIVPSDYPECRADKYTGEFDIYGAKYRNDYAVTSIRDPDDVRPW